MQKLLDTNQLAPSFTATNQDNQRISLMDYQGKNVVLYFYPKDDTPGCTIEANDFTRLASEFSSNNTIVIGVSKDDCDSHRAFIEKYKLNVQLLADTEGEICEKYGVWQEVEKEGVKKWKIVRSTFVIDKTGILIKVLYGVNHEGHAKDILEFVKTLA